MRRGCTTELVSAAAKAHLAKSLEFSSQRKPSRKQKLNATNQEFTRLVGIHQAELSVMTRCLSISGGVFPFCPEQPNHPPASMPKLLASVCRVIIEFRPGSF